MSNKKVEPPWTIITVAHLIKELNRENGLGKAKQEDYDINFKGEHWRIQKIK